MKTVRFIGDVHGKFNRYEKILELGIPTIQVGDMGVGFRRVGGYRDGEIHRNPPHTKMFAGNHRFIRGNHDNPAECEKHSQCIQDGDIEDGMMFIGGAVSIDREFRKEGYSWWPDEELSTEELGALYEKYLEIKPEVMVTHDCPEGVAAELARVSLRVEKLDPRFASRTRQVFHNMWVGHSPKLWVFGHWHVSFDHVLNGTRFVCLAELEWKDLEVGS